MFGLWKSFVYSGLAFALSAAPGFAQDLASHRAAYDISLLSVREGVAIETASGQVAYGVEKACGGWILAQTGTQNLHLATGDVVSQTLNFSSWESDSSQAFRFSSSTDGSASETILGQADIKPGEAGKLVFTRPEPQTITLPKGTLFPVAHSRFLIDGALKGEKQVEAFVLDGTEVGGAKLVTAFISPLHNSSRAIVKSVGGPLLQEVPGWSFRLAYFDPENQNGEPIFEIDADMLANGVATRWVVDYGDFAIEMKLTKIEGLNKPEC